MIKTKLPTADLVFEEARKVYEEQRIPRDRRSERVWHVVQSAFNGRQLLDQIIRMYRGEMP